MNWVALPYDVELFSRELDRFVPPKVFDAHAHLYDTGHIHGQVPDLLAQGPSPAGWGEFRVQIQAILPKRQVDGLFFAFPSPSVDVEAANQFVSEEVGKSVGSRGQMLIKPTMDPEFVRAAVRRHRFAGLKCYHVFSAEKPSFNATIPSYLPEEHFRIAHEEGLAITLHMVRARALADPVNQEAIRHFATRYPNARLILAHAARGFNPHHTIDGIESLRGIDNIWFDTSAITDCGAIEAILRTMGVKRLLYGSDFPVSHMRGRCVAMGDSFAWITHDNPAMQQPMGTTMPTLVGIESLRVLQLACINCRLCDADVQRIFLDNAVELFNGVNHDEFPRVLP